MPIGGGLSEAQPRQPGLGQDGLFPSGSDCVQSVRGAKMDPFSIASGCAGLITLIAQTTTAATAFIRTCRGAREDLTSVIGELTQLKTILELLKDDDASVMPERMRVEIVSLLNKCSATVREIEDVLEGFGDGRAVPVKWAASGKPKVEALRVRLKGYSESLSLTIDIVGL